jgi:RNA polymerase sigma-70 factor (ECF subfamily)
LQPDRALTVSELFPTTHWSVVLTGADSANPECRRALEALCRQYWYPVYAHARFTGHDRDEAQDLAQDFFVDLLEKHALRVADPERGRFRAFLKARFAHFLANQRRTSRALKRGGGRALLRIDPDAAESRYLSEPVDATTPEQSFEMLWARTMLARSFERLEGEMNAEGSSDRFRHLQPFLTGNLVGAAYRQAGQRLGLSEGAIKSAIYRLRRRFGQILRDEVAETVCDPDQVDDELRHLFAVLDG